MEHITMGSNKRRGYHLYSACVPLQIDEHHRTQLVENLIQGSNKYYLLITKVTST